MMRLAVLPIAVIAGAIVALVPIGAYALLSAIAGSSVAGSAGGGFGTAWFVLGGGALLALAGMAARARVRAARDAAVRNHERDARILSASHPIEPQSAAV